MGSFDHTRRKFFLSWLACTATAQPAGPGAAPVIVLIGPPGAGKTTQAGILKRERGMAIISADELIQQNHQAFERYRRPAINGVEPRLDPALNRLVAEKLHSVDLSKGVVFDGYPASKDQGDYLAKLIPELNLAKPIVIELVVPDDVVRKRLKDEKNQDVEQSLKDYHRELDFAHLYFPQAEIHKIDGTQKAATVAGNIRTLVARQPDSKPASRP